MIKTNILTNHFLVAMPNLVDLNFTRAVVYLYEHTKDGALGMIINQPLQINLGSVLNHLDISVTKTELADYPVFMGGPVGQEHGFIIYDQEAKGPNDAKELLVSASKEMLQEIAAGKGPNDFIITLGYSGWESGQLEREIARNDWLIVPYNRDILFKTPIEKRWQDTAALIGVDILHLSDQVGHA
ncbi:YqgE/AlgH family protein [Candidiatus Paracoxiella cheracis]|uniref:YqgE/AlgH family protein n=1 Tax=Candidiatus Paracoxiella cheracis TaxID=3405120 RepID=UPI003BF5EA39